MHQQNEGKRQKAQHANGHRNIVCAIRWEEEEERERRAGDAHHSPAPAFCIGCPFLAPGPSRLSWPAARPQRWPGFGITAMMGEEPRRQPQQATAGGRGERGEGECAREKPRKQAPLRYCWPIAAVAIGCGVTGPAAAAWALAVMYVRAACEETRREEGGARKGRRAIEGRAREEHKCGMNDALCGGVGTGNCGSGMPGVACGVPACD